MPRTVARRQRGEAAALPQWVAPQLTQLVDAAPEGDGWLHEILCGRPRPAKDVELGLGEVVRCSHMSGPLVRYIRPLALMEFAGSGPLSRLRAALRFDFFGSFRSAARPLAITSSSPSQLNERSAVMPAARNLLRLVASPRIITAQTIRAVLLASATAASLVGLRASSARTHPPSRVGRFRAWRSTATAPAVSRLRMYLSPRLLVRPAQAFLAAARFC
jgi:hypothetical protein